MFLQVDHLEKFYWRGSTKVEALKNVSFAIERGQFTSIMGPSGSGKSTLLQIIGGLDQPTSGDVAIEGESIVSLSDARSSAFRRQKLGFIFQFFNLFPNLNAVENVALPLLIDGKSRSEATAKANDLLQVVGLSGRAEHMPSELSGGEQQRVAVARALVADPLLILADEPTGNLDTQTGTLVLELLAKMVRERNQTVIMVTHDHRAASFGHRLISLRDGQVESDTPTAFGRLQSHVSPSC
jgi:putative ABC transport system ATP-binding protein